VLASARDDEVAHHIAEHLGRSGEMHRHSGVLSAVLIAFAASTSLAQTRASATAGVSRERPAMRAVSAKKAAPAPQAPATGNEPSFSLQGGIASGDGDFDLGLALGGSATWHPQEWPVAVRGDVYFAHHGGGSGPVDVSLNLFGVAGHALYTFPTTNSTVSPYVFGGVGLFYSNINVDYEGTAIDFDYDSSTDLGLTIGGGLSFTPRIGAEIRFISVNDFTTFPILLVIKL
jgi:hypothetical protein